MFNGRMLNIIRYLKEHGEATYKEMAKALGYRSGASATMWTGSTTYCLWSACRR